MISEIGKPPRKTQAASPQGEGDAAFFFDLSRIAGSSLTTALRGRQKRVTRVIGRAVSRVERIVELDVIVGRDLAGPREEGHDAIFACQRKLGGVWIAR